MDTNKIVNGTLAELQENENIFESQEKPSQFNICGLCGFNTVNKGIYEEFFQEIGKLVDEKQESYGDSFGKSGDVLRIFYPNGIRPDQYDDMLAVTRIIDKQFRIANNKDAFGESPFKDICGYGGLGAKRHEDLKNGK